MDVMMDDSYDDGDDDEYDDGMLQYDLDDDYSNLSFISSRFLIRITIITYLYW